MNTTKNILRIDASANVSTSNSKKLGDIFIESLTNQGDTSLVQRDLNQGLSFVDETWVGANFTPAESRTEAQNRRLEFSDQLVEELIHADHILLTTPMYNFSVPASLKAWIDLIARAGRTFRYTVDGPEGLLKDKKVDVIVTTGGVPLGSPMDFLSDYLRQVFRFVGIESINIIAADQMNIDADASFSKAQAKIASVFDQQVSTA